MTLKIERDTRLGPEYKIVFDYNNQHEQKLHTLMMGVEAMLNRVPSGPITKTQVYGYTAHIPEFIPECYVQSIMFEMVFTPRDRGNHINILMKHPEPLYTIPGIVSPPDFIENCKYKVLTRLLFDSYEYWTIQYTNDRQVFNCCRDWIYTHFGYNARTKVWNRFQQLVAEEVKRKYPTKEAFAAYVKKAAEASLKELGITPELGYYTDRLENRIRQYSKGADKFYQE